MNKLEIEQAMKITTEQVSPKDVNRGDTLWLDDSLVCVLESNQSDVADAHQYIRYQTPDCFRGKLFSLTDRLTRLVVAAPPSEPKTNRSMKVKSISVLLHIKGEFPRHCSIREYAIPLEFEGEYALKHPDTIYKTIAQVIKLEENEGEAK